MEMHYSKILLIVASVIHVSSSAYQFQPVQGGCSYWKFLSEDINRDKTKRLHCILDQHNQTGIIYTTWQLIPAGKCPYFDRYAGKLRTFTCDRRYGSCPKDSFHSNEVRRMEGCFNGLAIRQAYRELQQMNNSSPASNKQNEGENIKIIIAVISTLVIETLVICTCKFCVCSSKGRIWRNCGKKFYRYSAVKTRDEENGHRLKRCKGKGGYMPVQTTDDEDEEEQSNWQGSSHAMGCREGRISETDTDVKRCEEDFHLRYIPHVHRDLEVPPDAVKVQPNSQNETWIMDFIPLLSERESHKLLDDKEKTAGQIVICHEDRTSGTDTDVKGFSQDMICHESGTSGTDVHLKGKGEDCHLPITCVHQDLEVGPDAGKVQQNSQNEILIKNVLLSSSTRKSYEPFKSKEKVMATQTKVPENEGCNEEYQAREMKNQASQTNMPETEGHQTKQMENQATQTNRPENEGNNDGHQGKDIVSHDLSAVLLRIKLDLSAVLLRIKLDLSAVLLRIKLEQRKSTIPRTTAGGTESFAEVFNRMMADLDFSQYAKKRNSLSCQLDNVDFQGFLSQFQATKMNSINNELHSEDNQAKHNDSRATFTNNLKILAYNEDDQAQHNASQAIKTNIPNNRRHNEVTQWNIPLIERHRQLDQPGHMDNKDSELHKLLHWFVISMTKLISKGQLCSKTLLAADKRMVTLDRESLNTGSHFASPDCMIFNLPGRDQMYDSVTEDINTL